MPDIMLHLTRIFDKLSNSTVSDPNQLAHLMIYVLMPFMKIPTIAKCACTMRLPKDRLYSMLAQFDHQTWLRLFRFISYQRVFTIISSYADSYDAKKSRNRITIACDDTGFEKTGRRMPLVGKMWDHIIKKVTMGTQSLMFFVIVGDKKLQFPLDLRLCRGRGGRGRPGRPSKKKTLLVIDMLRDFKHAADAQGVPIERIVFVADRWFVASDIKKQCQKLGISLVIRGKTNLVFYINGERMTGKQLLASTQHKWRTYQGAGDRRYVRYVALSPSFGEVVLTIYKKGGRTILLIGSNQEHTSPKMIDDYELRWSIEVFFRDAKQCLHMGEFRFQTRDKITGHFVLRSISYHLIDWIKRYIFKGKMTAGQCIDYLYEEVFRFYERHPSQLGIHGALKNFTSFIGG